MTSGREKVTADDNGLTVHIREGNAPRLTITVRDDSNGRVFYTVLTRDAKGPTQVHESVTYYNVEKAQ